MILILRKDVSSFVIQSSHKEVSNAYRNFVLVMLTFVYVFNFIDRQLLVILQESIKKELSLSDTQLGMLSGLTFALFYVTVGIPIARWADKGNRRNIVAISLGLWSIMTGLSGMARNFVHLLLARIGVGVGEAGGSPPAHAMISDYFPPGKRATALSVYSTGIYFGMLIGFLMGGYLNQQLGWRTAFYVLGIPGVVFSLLFYAFVKEPKRGATDVSQSTAEHSFPEVVKLLFSKPTFAFLSMATALHVFCIYGVLNWTPSFLARVHGMNNADIGVALGLILGSSGAIGTFVGGFLTDRYGRVNKQMYIRIPAYFTLSSIPFVFGALYLKDSAASLFCFGVVNFFYSSYLGPSIHVAHSLVPAQLRALTSAILFFVLNLIGLGFGPLIVGMISDMLTPTYGAEGLKFAMTGTVVVSFIAVMLFLASARKLPDDLKSVK
jgi:predicted MFS family arabinose efflux permease